MSGNDLGIALAVDVELITVAAKSTSNKKRVGAVIVDGRGEIVATGFNHVYGDRSAPCEDGDGKTLDTVIHAEVDCLNRLSDLLRTEAGTELRPPYEMFVTHEPCNGCLASLKAHGVEYSTRKGGKPMPTKPPEGSVGLAQANGPITHGYMQHVEPPRIQDTLLQRGSTYGTFEGNAKITQGIMRILTENAQRPLADHELEAMHMIVHKLSRVVNGQRTKKDNWHDIAGYAKLAEDLTEDQ